jgi:hypothetical protein
MSLAAILTLLFAALGAVVGWRMQTRRMRWRSFLDVAPGGMTKAEHDIRRVRTARVRRLVVTALCAAAGAAIGLAASLLKR